MTAEHILVVEDDAAVARGLVYALDSEGFRTTWVTKGQDALRVARSEHPHLLLLDVRLPDLNGFDVTRQLRASGSRVPVLILTARDEEPDRILGLELGADDYIVKPYSLREVISRVRAHLRRTYGELAPAQGSQRLHFVDLELDFGQLIVRISGQPVALTPIEFRILRLLATNPNRLFTRSKIIENVWGYGAEIENERTVDVHIRHLRQKLEADPAQPRWIETVRGTGYRFNT